MDPERTRQLGQGLMALAVVQALLFLLGVARRSYAAIAIPMLVLVAAASGVAFWVGWTMSAVRTCGLEPEPRIINGGLDANWMTAHGLPTVTLGCGQSGIHTVKETLDVGQYLQACRIGLLLASGAES